jgi:protein-S-isoprenylcysteine O-methyltransferase Ste14
MRCTPHQEVDRVNILKTLLFTVLVPGTVAGFAPGWIRGAWPTDAPPWAVAAGTLALAAGLAVYVWCAWNFATVGQGTPLPLDPPRVLVARGLYRYSRNPMYVGVLLVIVGQAVWARSVPLLEYAAAVAVSFHLVVLLVEEPVLRRSFGASYEDYVSRVHRWFGRRPAGRVDEAAARRLT